MRLTSAYPEKYALSVFLPLGIGGGIITRKLLFAVMLVTAMSLTGIAGASAANVENLQIHTSNSSTVQEKFNTQIDNKYIINNSTTTQKSVDKIWKHVKKASSNHNNTTLNRNLVKEEKIHKAKKSSFNRTHYAVQNISYASYWHDIATKATAQNKTNKTTKIACKTFNSTTNQSITLTNLIIENSAKTAPIHSTINTTKVKNTNTTTKEPEVAEKTNTKSTASNTTEPALAAGSSSTSKVPASLQPYLKATKNCQVTNSQIKSLASKITRGKTTTYAKAVAIFNWVRNNLGYSFYYNTKKGAVGALNARTGNCVDTAHLVIALERAAGIPARYVHGNARFTSGHVYGHVWAEVYVNGKWYKADATSNKNSFGVVKNWTRATIKGRYASLPF